MSKDELMALTAPYGQEHLLTFWEQLSPSQQQSLAAQIRHLDFALLDRLFRQRDPHGDLRTLAARARSPRAFRLNGEGNRFTPQEARQRGQELLAAGRLGVVLVAGGQGTRLGFDHPKGMYPVGPISGRSLFQIHVEKIVAAGRRYGGRIPLYLMTSPATHEETVAFFAEHARFGLPPDDFRVFCQAVLPAVDAQTGKVLLEQPDRVFVSPDGHGGMLAALAESGGLAEFRRCGIEQLFYLQVDNPLVDIAGPEFVGYHLLAGSELTTQAIAKRDPLEKVGNVVEVDGILRIIEYSDLPEEVARRRAADGSLQVWAGSIGVHMMDVALLARVAAKADALPLHRARKKVSHLDRAGRTVEPTQPNAIKFERFIFDLLPYAAHGVVVEVDARRCFAPLKNAPGQAQDSPETVQAQMIALHTEWLRQAGAEVPDGLPVEISPLFALDAAEVAQRVKPGTRIDRPTYFHGEC